MHASDEFTCSNCTFYQEDGELERCSLLDELKKPDDACNEWLVRFPRRDL